MEPIPETRAAIEEYGPFVADADLLEDLARMASQVLRLVPDCLGFSLALREHGVTFTLVATDQEIAALDALQYLADGPCLRAIEEEAVLTRTSEDILAEEDWRLFAEGAAARSVRSTLTIPVLVDETVVGTVNLYGASSDSFVTHHEELAAVFDAWAPGAVANADLGFSTRLTAEQAPRLLDEELRLSVAAGILMYSQGLPLDDARERLQAAATRAGISVVQLADHLIAVSRGRGGSR